MNTPKTKEIKEGKAVEKPRDPFAVDFFGKKESNSAREEKAQNDKKELPVKAQKAKLFKQKKWFETLPQMKRGEVEFSRRLDNLPEKLTKQAALKIAETISRFTFQPPGSVKCSLISMTEVNLSDTVGQIQKSPQTFLQIGCQPAGATCLIALETGFALSAIDLILTGKVGEPGVPRDLSLIEKTIIEFLGVNIIGGINDWIGEPLLKMQTNENDIRRIFERDERGAEAVFRLDFASFSGIITLLASNDFFAGLDKTQNPIFAEKTKPEHFRQLEKIAPNLPVRLQIGSTELDAAALSFLEKDDIVLIEQPALSWENGAFSGQAQIFAGSGKNFRLNGKFAESDTAGEFSETTSVEIEEITSVKMRRESPPNGFDMDKKEIEKAETEPEESNGGETAPDLTETSETAETAEDETNGAALENILVNLSVEIAGKKISLREVQKLRAGQVINLGCRPTDPVRLVTDSNDQPVAIGELVDIEGQLGVRLTRVFI